MMQTDAAQLIVELQQDLNYGWEVWLEVWCFKRHKSVHSLSTINPFLETYTKCICTCLLNITYFSTKWQWSNYFLCKEWLSKISYINRVCGIWWLQRKSMGVCKSEG